MLQNVGTSATSTVLYSCIAHTSQGTLCSWCQRRIKKSKFAPLGSVEIGQINSCSPTVQCRKKVADDLSKSERPFTQDSLRIRIHDSVPTQDPEQLQQCCDCKQRNSRDSLVDAALAHFSFGFTFRKKRATFFNRHADNAFISHEQVMHKGLRALMHRCLRVGEFCMKGTVVYRRSHSPCPPN